MPFKSPQGPYTDPTGKLYKHEHGPTPETKFLWLTLRWLVSPKTALRFLLRGGPGLYRIRTALYATPPVFFLCLRPAGNPRAAREFASAKSKDLT